MNVAGFKVFTKPMSNTTYHQEYVVIDDTDTVMKFKINENDVLYAVAAPKHTLAEAVKIVSELGYKTPPLSLFIEPNPFKLPVSEYELTQDGDYIAL